jgi:hypothetical protein
MRRWLYTLSGASLLLAACGETPLGAGDAAAAADAVTDLGVRGEDTGTPIVAPADVPTPGEDVPAPTPLALWRLPRGTGAPEAFQVPWPNDLSRDAMGRVRFDLFPQQGVHALVRTYLTRFEGRLDGFSPNGAVYLRFGMALDATTLPGSARATLSAESPLQLVDVDPASPQRGERVPLQWYVRDSATRYWAAHTLAVAPVHGYPLRPATRYALVATTALRGAGAVALSRDADLDAVLAESGGDEAVGAARRLYAPAVTALEAAGVPRARVLSLSVFTTGDPTSEFFRAADWLRSEGPQPRLIDIDAGTAGEGFITFRGHYGPNPVFQSGAAPYGEIGSGDFVPDAQGIPRPQGTEDIRFVLTVPTNRTRPAGGWPIAIYAHGTGGNASSFVSDRTAAALAAQGVATLGFDQIFHGERATPGTSPDTAFFNFTNPFAGRTNNRQAALDLVQCGRFVRALTFVVPWETGPVTERFDPDQVFFYGHSQGGLNGPLWLAAEPTARAAVLSGAAGVLALSIVLKTEPVNIPQTITSVLQLQRDELVALHPLATLLQTLADPADPINYARFIVREPRAGQRGKHIFQTQGFVDRYSPPAAIAALALATGLPLTAPVGHPEPGWDLLGLAPSMLPLRGNVMLPGMGQATTASWMQFNAPSGRDGHFVVFDVPDARLRAAAFLGTAARDPEGIPTVVGSVE